jgi:hypothetical protein
MLHVFNVPWNNQLEGGESSEGSSVVVELRE